jgi:hypothetical protein
MSTIRERVPAKMAWNHAWTPDVAEKAFRDRRALLAAGDALAAAAGTLLDVMNGGATVHCSAAWDSLDAAVAAWKAATG